MSVWCLCCSLVFYSPVCLLLDSKPLECTWFLIISTFRWVGHLLYHDWHHLLPHSLSILYNPFWHPACHQHSILVHNLILCGHKLRIRLLHSSFSMWPLIQKDGQALSYVACMFLFLAVACHVLHILKAKPRKGLVSFCRNSYSGNSPHCQPPLLLWPLFSFRAAKFHSKAQKVHKYTCKSEVVRIGSIIISHQMSKLWKAKFFILCDVIFLVRLQEKFDIDLP